VEIIEFDETGLPGCYGSSALQAFSPGSGQVVASSAVLEPDLGADGGAAGTPRCFRGDEAAMLAALVPAVHDMSTEPSIDPGRVELPSRALRNMSRSALNDSSMRISRRFHRLAMPVERAAGTIRLHG